MNEIPSKCRSRFQAPLSFLYWISLRFNCCYFSIQLKRGKRRNEKGGDWREQKLVHIVEETTWPMICDNHQSTSLFMRRNVNDLKYFGVKTIIVSLVCSLGASLWVVINWTDNPLEICQNTRDYQEQNDVMRLSELRKIIYEKDLLETMEVPFDRLCPKSDCSSRLAIFFVFCANQQKSAWRAFYLLNFSRSFALWT